MPALADLITQRATELSFEGLPGNEPHRLPRLLRRCARQNVGEHYGVDARLTWNKLDARIRIMPAVARYHPHPNDLTKLR